MRSGCRRSAADQWLYPNLNIGCVARFDDRGEVLESLWDRRAENHPMITSMREHKGWVYLGGITNNRIGRVRLNGRDDGWSGSESYWGKGGDGVMGLPNFRFLDRFLGRGAAAVTVPPLDGGLKPNNVLEDLPPGIAGSAPDDLALWQGAPVWSDGPRLMGAQGEVTALAADITAIAAGGGRLALAGADGSLRLLDEGLADVTPKLATPPRHVTAVAFAPDGGLWFTTGSEAQAPKDWRRDLMEKNRAGLLGRLDPASGEVRIVQHRLAWPAGLAVRTDGRVVVSEAWRSHIVEFDAAGQGGQILLDEIPGYPGRLSPRAAGGFWLAVFAPRSPLIEFVLREPGYRRAMLDTLDPAHRVAPSYSSGGDFHEPMQGGALKQMGILKPWAPSLSYGLVVGLDDDFIPQESFHSRAGGRRHGITAALETGGALWLAGRGSAEILTLTLGQREDAA